MRTTPLAKRTPELEATVKHLEGWRRKSSEDTERDRRELNAEIEALTKARDIDRAALQRAQLQREVTSLLSRTQATQLGDLQGFVRELTERAAEAMSCERVNVWTFSENESELSCIDLFLRTTGEHSAGEVLKEAEFSHEFAVLRTSRFVDADDALTDPRTAGYVESYLKPLHITSMLDAVINVGGKNLGLLCFEHVDTPHHWEQDEIEFACQLADKIGIDLIAQMRRHAEEELRLSESRFRTLFNSINDAVFVHDPLSGTFLDVNRRAAEVFGYTYDELLGGDVAMLSVGEPPYSQADALVRIAAAARGESAVFEWRFKTRDGHLFWGEVSLRRAVLGSQEVVLAAVRDISERKRVEQDLQFANQLMQTQMENSLDGILVTDQFGHIQLSNRRFADIWRVPPEVTAAGAHQPIVDVVFAQVGDTDAFKERVQHLFDNPDEQGDDEITTLDGRIIDRHSAPLKAADGRYLGRAWFFRDITERKNVESVLRQERDFSAALISELPGVFALLDETARIVRWNENLAVVTGISSNQLQGVDAFINIIESDRRRVAQTLAEAFVSGHADVEFGIYSKAGDIRTYHLTGRVLMHEGHPHMICIGVDVTDERLAKQQLQASEERFRAVSETAQDAILTTDSAGRIIFWNRAATRIFGFSAEEVIGKQLLEVLVPPQFREMASQGIRSLATTGHHADAGRTFEVAATHKDGTNIAVELSLSTMLVGAEWQTVSILRDITQRKLTEADMMHRARYDSLTELANRAVFAEELDRAIARAYRDGKTFAVLYLDLDHFKDVNDTLGHPIGDLLLQAVAQRLKTVVRETDLVARFGGDEFAVLGSEVGEPEDAAGLADKVLKALGEPYSVQGNDIRTGASVGIAVYGPDSPDAEGLLAHADVALYRAKSEGRGTYRFFTEAMDQEVRTRVTLGRELRTAIAAGQLFLVYQPQVNVETNRITGVEALVRWHHPTRGLVSPAEFIPVAESSGLIVALGHWVLHAACRQMKDWLDAGIAPPLIGVNLSALQFKAPRELEDDINSALTTFGLSPERLEVELTESVFMDASREHNDVLLRLRQSGLRVAIDDFGTGYSSLEYLGRFPVDRVKIAQNFLIDLMSGSANATIVKAAIGMAHDLGLDVIVEGVETAEQLALIRTFSGHTVQGYYFSKPLPADEATAVLRTGKIVRRPLVAVETAAE